MLEVKDEHVNRDEFVNDDLKNQPALRVGMKQVSSGKQIILHLMLINREGWGG